MLPRPPQLLALVLLLGLVACASTRDPQPGVSSDQIVVEELSDEVGGLSAYEIVERYRPQWLRKRGESSILAADEIAVYLDNNRSRLGPPSALRQLPAMDIASIRHLSAAEAQAEYGLNNVQGAIVVHTKDGR